ncbi:MAG: HD domain-containing protein [Candidatus Omnitrophota bacterium]
MDKKFISDFKVNEQVTSVFMLRKKNLKLTKYDKPYLEMTLSDKTGKIEGRLWDDAEKYNEAADTGDFVLIKGTVDKYREEKQLKVDYLVKADERAFCYEDMVRVAANREKYYNDILTYLKSIKNVWVKSLSELFVKDEKLMASFKDGIGGKSWHNAYIGGLMEHTFEVMYISQEMCRLCGEADRDIALFGAFIHDIGKVRELDPKKLEYTVEGGLLGHIAIGYRILTEKISEITDFPYDLRLRLEHIILSHHGEYEQQSPVLPKTLEATIIYHADELVSQANAIKEIQVGQKEEGKTWSNYVTIKNRKYFIKSAAEEGWSQENKESKQSGQAGSISEEADGSDEIGDLF